MIYVPIPKDSSESLSLVHEETKNRCCYGLIRIYGSDGVYSWTVAFANFIINVIIGGLERISGILYVEFMKYFRIDRQMASIPFSIQQAGRHLFGPLAGILGQKYGLRFITVLGGIIGSVCSAVLYFKMDTTFVTIFWGLFFGLSIALTTTLNQISVDQYFEKHRTTAGGFAVSGTCVGAFFFPALFNSLLHRYGIKGAFLIMAAFTLNVIAAALLLSEPPWKRKKTTDIDTYDSSSYGTVNVPKNSHIDVERRHKNSPLKKKRSKDSQTHLNFSALENNSDIVFQLLTLKLSNQGASSSFHSSSTVLDKLCLMGEIESLYLTVTNPQMKGSSAFHFATESDAEILNLKTGGVMCDKNNLNDDVYVKNTHKIYLRKKLQELFEARGTHVVSHFPYGDQARAWKVLIELRKLHAALTDASSPPRYSATSLTKDMFEIKKTKPVIRKKKRPNTFLAHIKTAAKLHCNLIFLLICVCRGVFMMSFIPVMTIVVDFALDKGLKMTDDTLIIAVLSLGDLLGRVSLGWITDHNFLSLPKYMLIGMVMLGINTASLPLMRSRLTILVSILTFGILQGSLYVRHPILVSKYMKSHEQAIGMGTINLLSGFLGFTHPAFIGYFRDTLGSYDKMFYLNGFICILVGLAWFLEPFLVQISTKKHNKRLTMNIHYQSI